ncbi:hypothetical protein NESM_000258800 [Novymonas esmeraldas]|uniref:Uncharacterized protein n=1 Tax=Novymonas esmeraldas TaxID=1808958 RepID=A0AAW0FDC8_9TRYP
MGTTHSTAPVEGQGHPDYFYRGVAAAKEGRCTVAEIYFAHAMNDHRGRSFWAHMIPAVLPTSAESVAASSKAPPPKQRGSGDAERPPVTQDQQCARAAVVYRATGAFGSTVSDASSHACDVGQSPVEWPTESPHDTSPCTEVPDIKADVEVEADAEAEAEEVIGAAAAPVSDVVDVFFPLNGRVSDVLDYFRMLADIALTYFEMLATTQHEKKMTSLAARYCLLTISHTQVLLHCLTLWKEEHLGSDGGGFIDYERKRHANANVGAVTEEVAAVWPDSEVSVTVPERRPETHLDSSDFVTLALVEANCRYYYLSSLLNYTRLLTKACAVAADDERRALVYGNILEHLDAVFASVRSVALDYPQEYLSDVILAHIPSCMPHGGGYGDGSSRATGSERTHPSWLGISGDTHRHLYASGCRWSPLWSALIPLACARKVRLNVQESSRHRGHTNLLSPAQRVTYYYCCWATKATVLTIPGCSQYLLSRALSGAAAGKGTQSHKTQLLVRRQALQGGSRRVSKSASRAPHSDMEGVTVSLGTLDTNGVSRGCDAVSGSADSAAQLKALARRSGGGYRRSGRHVNTDLDLSDERTCIVVSQDEASQFGASGLLCAVLLMSAGGLEEAAASYATALERLVCDTYGPDSEEMNMTRYWLQNGIEA